MDTNNSRDSTIIFPFFANRFIIYWCRGESKVRLIIVGMVVLFFTVFYILSSTLIWPCVISIPSCLYKVLINGTQNYVFFTYIRSKK